MRSENRIFVDAAGVIGEVEPNIYGFNVEHIHHDQTEASIVYGAIFDEGSPQVQAHGSWGLVMRTRYNRRYYSFFFPGASISTESVPSSSIVRVTEVPDPSSHSILKVQDTLAS